MEVGRKFLPAVLTRLLLPSSVAEYVAGHVTFVPVMEEANNKGKLALAPTVNASAPLRSVFVVKK